VVNLRNLYKSKRTFAPLIGGILNMNTLEKMVLYGIVPVVSAVVISDSASAVERIPRKPLKHISEKSRLHIKATHDQKKASDNDEHHYVIKEGDIVWKILKHCNPSLDDTTIARYVNAMYEIQNLHETYKQNFKVDNRSFVKTAQQKDSLTHNPDEILLDEVYKGNILSYTNDQLERKHIDKQTIACLNGLSTKKESGAWSIDVRLAYKTINQIIDRVNEEDRSIDTLFNRTDSLEQLNKEFAEYLKTVGIGINKVADDVADMKTPKFRVSLGSAYQANEGFSPVISLGTRVHDARNPTWIGLDINGTTQKDFSKDSIVYDGGATIIDRENNLQRIRISPYIDQRLTIGHSKSEGVLGLQAGPSFDIGQNRLSVTTTQRVDDMYGNPRSWKSDRLPDQKHNESAVLFNYGASLKLGKFDVAANQQVAKGRKPTSTMRLGYYFGL
jgi:hypothetical protein